MRIARSAFVLVLALGLGLGVGGCAGDPGDAVPTPAPETASPTPTPTPDGPVAEYPAAYPIEPRSGWDGVQFTLAAGDLQCAIFDPTEESEFQAAPYFGCGVSADDFPYPPFTGGPRDTANGFVSSGHETGRLTTITDATFSGNGMAPALAAGHALTWGTVTCEAIAADEVVCTDADSGHGVRVSVRDYELF